MSDLLHRSSGLVRIAVLWGILTQLATAQEAGNFNEIKDLFYRQFHAGRYDEAEQTADRLVRLAQGEMTGQPLPLANATTCLGLAYREKRRYKESESQFKLALANFEKALGIEHDDVVMSLVDLASAYSLQARYADAEPLLKRALAIREKNRPADHPDVAGAMSELAALYQREQRLDEAEVLHKRAIAVLEKAVGPSHQALAGPLNNLAILYSSQGRTGEAQPLLQRVATIRETSLGSDSPHLQVVLNNLAVSYEQERQYAKAEPIRKRILASWQKILGPNHRDLMPHIYRLADVYLKLNQHAEAEPLIQKALQLSAQVLGPDDPSLAQGLRMMASIQESRQEFDQAESSLRRALAIREKSLGGNHPEIARDLFFIARLQEKQDKFASVEKLIAQARTVCEQPGTDPSVRWGITTLLGDVMWKTGRREAAIDQMKNAIEQAERHFQERADNIPTRVSMLGLIEFMLSHAAERQVELGNVREVLELMEQHHKFCFTSGGELIGFDLLHGLKPEQVDALRKHEQDARSCIRGVETREATQVKEAPKAGEQDKQNSEDGLAELSRARQDLVAACKEIRRASATYSLFAGENGTSPSLERIQQRVDRQKALFLEYLVGGEKTCLLIVAANRSPRVIQLDVTAEQAGVLSIEPGPLTLGGLLRALANPDQTGVLQRLRASTSAEKDLTLQLAALFEVLVPQAERDALVNGDFERIVIVPDGPLVQLPFDVLVVDQKGNPRYLLDLDVSIQATPTVAALMSLEERNDKPPVAAVEPVLSVGNCSYESPADSSTASILDTLDQLAVRSRFAGLGGRLVNSPNAAAENRWVSKVFQNSGLAVARLEGDEATEGNLRSRAAGRRVLHLSCRGVIAQTSNMFFGSLALTPPKNKSESSDDGYLGVHEAQELSLRGCELVILSACETNQGQGPWIQGVWAMSRGFLSAGARRVVVSDWLVDDEAAPSLVSYFCSLVGQAEKKGGPVDYAKALYEAKRWVRKQEKWQSPYYWGAFVLVGPN